MRLFFPRSIIYFLLFLTSPAFSKGWWMWTPGDTVDNSTQSLLSKGYKPDQPIKFSHKLHAFDNQITCEYCHSSARRSTHAGIPPVNTCMGCHKHIKTESDEIKKVAAYYKNNEPIKWTKVHDLPDFVRFSHKVHVLAKDTKGKSMLQCQDCHGQVQGTLVAEQHAPLQMGWCIECHDRVKIPAQNGKKAVKNASVSCNTCHY